MSPQLSLDIKQIFIPKTITQFLEDISKMDSVREKIQQVDNYVNILESEKRKMEVLQLDVHLSMLLINDAIVALKEELMMLKKSLNVKPVLEEFMPLKNSCDDVKVEINEENGDKKNWLSSTHLWNANENLTEEEDVRRTIFSPEINGNGRLIPFSTTNFQSNIKTGSSVHAPLRQQASRKQRRCWSTELHRRFVNALQQLGGSQVATPKQIRELMQVDGLTSDEVKSHLQKYRLHSRRLQSSSTTQTSAGVVVERLWLSKCSDSQSSSPDGPLPTGAKSMYDEEDGKCENNCWNKLTSDPVYIFTVSLLFDKGDRKVD
ncbi:transcription factor HHO2-like [Rutidosis leptorrhynchoides]|uniref:transcription factor HHO2-like n=1 Tax=Rutidosis leptorrhynchoides TaxID=125765 RepID=UPI003A9A034A